MESEANESNALDSTDTTTAEAGTIEDGMEQAPTTGGGVSLTSDVRRIADITLSKKETDQYLQKMYRKAQQNIQLKGFRKGHVPLSLIEKMYRKQLEADAYDEAAQEEFRKYVEREGVNPIGTPAVISLVRTEEGGIAMKILYEMLPQFDLAEYKGLRVRRVFHNVTDEEVEQEIDGVRESLMSREPAEIASDDSHIVTLDLQKLENDEPVEGSVINDIELYLNRQQVNPDLKAAARNTKAGDTFRVELPTGEDMAMISYEATVKKVEKAALPEIDDEFAAKVTGDPGATPEVLRRIARDSIEGRYDQQYTRIFRDQLVGKLLESYDFDVPVTLVQMVLDSFVEEKQGKNKELPANFDREKHDEEMRPVAERTVRWMLVRDRIVEKEGLKAEEVDFEGLADIESQRTGIAFDTLMKYFRNNNETTDRIIAEKVLQLLEDYAIVDEIEDRQLSPAEGEESFEGADPNDAGDDDSNRTVI